MLKYDGKEFRNLEEQVRKNQSDIEKILTEVQLADLGIKIVQAIPLPSESDLPLPYDGEYGDGFLVGVEAPYELYVWTRASNEYNGAWFDWGVLNAPSVIPGPQGEQGETGPQGERGSLWTSNNGAPTVSQNNKNGDQFLNTATGNVYEYQNGVWTITGNIQGPQGIQGIQGPKGDTGAQGEQGIQGIQGEPGQWIQIIDELTNIDQLPDPDDVPRYYAYVIPVSGVKHLYVISGDDTLIWLDCGAFTGPQGETGPQGPQGIQGVPGVGISSIASGTTSQTQDGYTQTPITFTKTDNSTSTLNVLAKNAPDVSSITAGTPTSSGGYTTTPITFNYSDNTNQTVNIQAKNGEDAGHLYRHECAVEINGRRSLSSYQYAYLRFEVFDTSSSLDWATYDDFKTWFLNHGRLWLLPGSYYYSQNFNSAYFIYEIRPQTDSTSVIPASVLGRRYSMNNNSLSLETGIISIDSDRITSYSRNISTLEIL